MKHFYFLSFMRGNYILSPSSLYLRLNGLLAAFLLLLHIGIYPPTFAQNAAMMDANLEVIAANEPIPGWLEFKENLNTTPTTIFDDYKSNFGLSTYDDMQLLNSITDKYGFTHHYYQQTYQDILVENGLFRILSHLQSNTVWRGNGKIIKHIELNPIPNLNNVKAVLTAIEYVEADEYAWEVDNSYNYPIAELMIVTTGESNILTYKVDVYTSVPYGGEAVYVDAQNGGIIKTVSLYNDLCGEEEDMYAACTESVNKDVNNWFFDFDVCIKTTEEDGVFKLKDLCRQPHNCSFNEQYIKIELQASIDPTGMPIDEDRVFYIDDNEPLTDNDFAKGAYGMSFAASKAYDYFSVLGADFQNHNCTSQFVGRIGGNNISGDADFGVSLAGSMEIDVIVHEFTHVIARNKPFPLKYEIPTVSLGIEESFCDILGIMTDYYVRNSFGEVMEPDYNQALTGRDFGNYQSLVYNEDGSINTMGSNYNYTAVGVHYEIGGVQSHWFYLLSEGGEGIRIDNSGVPSGGDPIGGSYNICSIGFELATDIAFNNYYFELGQNELNFENARQGSLWALDRIFQNDTSNPDYVNAKVQIMNAWYAVNVGEPYNEEYDKEEIIGDLNFCHGEGTVLDAGADYAAYSWSTGETTQTIFADEIGSYSVDLTGEDEEGNLYCDANQVSVQTSLFIDLGTDENGEGYHCLGTILDAGLEDGYDFPHTYQWSTGSTAQTIVPEQVGVYTVTVTNLETNCANIEEINMIHLWHLNVEALDNSVVQESEDTFRACSFPIQLGVVGDFDLSSADLWLYNEAIYLGPNTEPFLQILSPGDYRVSLRSNSTSNEQIIQGNGYCTSNSLFTVLGPVSFSGFIPEQGICAEGTFGAELESYFSGATSYRIIRDNMEIAIVNNLNDFPVLVGGDYQIIGQESSCDSEAISNEFFVTVSDVSVEIIVTNPNEDINENIICGRTELTANVMNEGMATIESLEWSIGSEEPMITVQQSGTYDVVVNYSTGCTATATVEVTVYPMPEKPTIQKTDIDPGCGKILFGGALFYDHIGAYTWYLEGEEYESGVGDDEILAKTPGTYILEWKNIADSESGEGCAMRSNPITFTTEDFIDEVDFTAASDNTDALNEDFETIVSSSKTSNQVIWDGDNTTNPNPDIVTTEPEHILGTLIVPNGLELVITNRAIDFLDEYSGIWVHNGGRLRIEGASLQAHECNSNWAGIKVEGNKSVFHQGWYSDPPSDFAHPEHGIVIMTDGSIIQDATIGIHAYAVTDVVGSDAGGGFVHVEGGIIPNDRNQFINNKIAIQIERHDGAQRSLIANTDFINDAIFPNQNVNNWAGEYNHILLAQASKNIDGAANDGLHIYGNSFSTASNSGLEGEAKGTGIFAYRTNVIIGQRPDGDFQGNQFSNLYRGVNVSNPLTIDGVTSVIDNTFTGVERSITLNTSHFSQVGKNNITVPYIFKTLTYGIFARQSHNLVIQDNELFMNTNVTGPNETRGLILQDCFAPLAADGTAANDPLEQSLIKNNIFRGDFASASQMEGDDQATQFQCNHYVGLENTSSQVPERDWFLPANSLDDEAVSGGLGLPTLLGVFLGTGVEVNDCATLPLSQQWHDGSSGVHVQNEATTAEGNPINMLLHIDAPNSAPSLLSGNGFTSHNDCGEPDVDCVDIVMIADNDNDGGIYNYPHYPPIDPRPVDSSFPCQVNVELMHYWLATAQVQSAINALDCKREVWTDKLLVGTYTAQGNTAMAQQVLARIPQNTAENAEFHQLFNAVHQKQIYPIQQIAEQPNSVNAGIAQSILAEWRGDIYNRAAMPIPSQSSKVQLDKTVGISNNFQLFPNPSSQFVKVVFESNHDESKRNLTLFNLEGQKVAHYQVSSLQSIDIENLQSGMYYVHLEGFTALSKLLIIH